MVSVFGREHEVLEFGVDERRRLVEVNDSLELCVGGGGGGGEGGISGGDGGGGRSELGVSAVSTTSS